MTKEQEFTQTLINKAKNNTESAAIDVQFNDEQCYEIGENLGLSNINIDNLINKWAADDYIKLITALGRSWLCFLFTQTGLDHLDVSEKYKNINMPINQTINHIEIKDSHHVAVQSSHVNQTQNYNHTPEEWTKFIELFRLDIQKLEESQKKYMESCANLLEEENDTEIFRKIAKKIQEIGIDIFKNIISSTIYTKYIEPLFLQIPM